MKRLTALALLLVTTALYSEPEIRHELDDVGVSVVLPPSWKMQGEDSVRKQGSVTQYGVSYLIDSDITRDEVLVERFDNLDAAERNRLLEGDYRAGSTEDLQLHETGPLPIEVPGFEDASIFRYRHSREAETDQQSSGYMLFAVDGPRAWRIRVGGLDRSFRLDPARYRRILESVRIEQPESDDRGVSELIPLTAGG